MNTSKSSILKNKSKGIYMVQKQKQKQSVVINIGEVKTKRKRKRKRLQKKRPLSSQFFPPPPPPPPQDFAKVIYPVNALRPDENIQAQLNTVTKQLFDLQEKSKNRTANLMAGVKAVERQAEQELGIEVEPTQEQIGIATQTAPALSEEIIRIKRKKKPAPEPEPESVVPELPPAPESEKRGRGRPRGRSSKERSDKGKSRGPSLRTASVEALKRGYALAAIKTGGAEDIPSGQTTLLNPPAEDLPKL
jgi:hypothetical protein